MSNDDEAPSERWRRVERVYLSALGRTDLERSALLDDLCGGDDTLRRDVESLLRVQPEAGGFLDTGAMAVAAEIMRGELGTDLIGQTLDGYTITGRLGAGGMGEVYRAHDSRLGRDVAIKLLPTDLADNPDRLSRFDREARALAALNHPNIATIHGIAQTAEAASSGRASSVRAIILELVEGEMLSERLARAPVPLNEALGIARQIAEALDAAHERGIIHRDLKPLNIKIRPDGRVKVLDFGLAKLVNQVDGTSGFNETKPLTVSATQPGLVIGTAAYMSPEQARGVQVDKRTDIWAFGCILYEMLASRPAFGGATTADTMASVLEREPDWNAMSPRTPPEVMSLVQRCLDKDVRHRLRDIGDSHRVLSGVADVWQSTPVGRLASTQRALPWIAVAGLAAVTVGVWFLRPSAPAGVPIQTTHSQITIPGNGTIGSAFPNALAVAPDGRKIAMVVELNQKTGVWVKALEESTARLVPGSDGAEFVLWSRDSKSLAFRVLYKLLRFDMGSGAPAAIAPMPRGPTFGADWGDDGTTAGSILFLGGAGIMRVSGSGGEPVAIGVTDAIYPQMLPRGRFFYTSPQKAAVFGASFDHPAASVEILKEGAAPVYAPRAGEVGNREDGFLLWIRGTTLLAQAFDPTTMRRAGEAIVLADPAWTVAVSPSLLLYDPAPAMSQFAWVDRTGKVLRLVGDPAPFGFTTMSPDGSRVVVTVTTNTGIQVSPLWMLDTQRGVRNRLVADGGNTSPVWSPDGQTVLFGSDKGLTRIASSGVGDPDVVHPFPRRINPTDWSRRGFVVFNQVGLGTEPFDRSTEMNIMMLQVTRDGKPAGKATPYLQKPGAQSGARFSPDGDWVAYEESVESGQSEVFIDTFRERHRAIQISTNGGFGARWNPQGGELFYRTPAGQLMAVSLKMDKHSADVSTPRELFTLPVSTLAYRSQFDVGPDGNQFLILVAVKKAPLELITNWQALLK